MKQELACPYTTCNKQFQKPVLVTDYSKLPRETYYACPHCMLRLELLMERGESLKGVQVRTSEDDLFLSQINSDSENRRLGEPVSNPQATRPSKTCRHFLGFLRLLPRNLEIPDDCTTCPNIVQCYIRRE